MSWDPQDEEIRDRRDAVAIQVLAPLSTTYLPWTVSAMRPAGLVAVLNEIVVNQRRSIVELGGGVSTHYIGRVLRQRGGHLWTVEHDGQWADQLERQLAEEGLGDLVTVVRAPLTGASSPWDDDAVWYDRDLLAAAFAGTSVDLLIVDGPPAWQAGKGHARYPAAGFFAPVLAADYAIILDDINRGGEQDIMDAWERELSITFERRLLNGVIGIGRPGPAFTI
jgi:hypothetical protein